MVSILKPGLGFLLIISHAHLHLMEQIANLNSQFVAATEIAAQAGPLGLQFGEHALLLQVGRGRLSLGDSRVDDEADLA